MKHKLIFFSISTWLLIFSACQNTNPTAQNQLEEKKDFYTDGKIQRHYWLKNGKKDSTMVSYSHDGYKTGEMFFKNDIQQGAGIFYYPSGKIKEQQTIKDGKREGKVILWHENGQLKAEANFQNDKLNGVYKKWDEQGTLIFESIFAADTVQKAIYQAPVSER